MCLIQLRVLVIYLDPILCPVPRLHAPRHKGGINEIIIQQLKTPTARGSSIGHGRRLKRRNIFYHRLAHDNLSTHLGVRINRAFELGSGAIVVPGSGAVAIAASATSSVAIVSIAAVSMATTSGIVVPSVSGTALRVP
jgi:hypothetical protein